MDGNADIISGIKNINDPDNYFAGLARINKDLNKGGARFVITSTGEVQINSAHMIDPAEFASLSRAERAQVLSGLPAPQQTMTKQGFNLVKTDIYNTFTRFKQIPDLEIGALVTKLMSNKEDIGSIAFILGDVAEEAREKLLELFLEVLQSVLNNVIENILKELYPFVSVPVAVMQFLMKFVREIGEKFGLNNLDETLQLCFDREGQVIPALAKKIVDDLFDWANKKLELLNAGDERSSTLTNCRKIRTKCSDCEGDYWLTKKI